MGSTTMLNRNKHTIQNMTRISQTSRYLMVAMMLGTGFASAPARAQVPTANESSLQSLYGSPSASDPYSLSASVLMTDTRKRVFLPVTQRVGDSLYVADVGLRPNVNGFKFQNYGRSINTGPAENPSESSVVAENLTAIEMIRLFGESLVCASGSGQSCVLKPEAKQWMDNTNNSMNGGHCAGFAVLASMVYSGSVSTAGFGGGSLNALSIAGNTALQREIAYWWATQIVLPGGGIGSKPPPVEMLDALILELRKSKPNHDLLEIGFNKRDGSGGHAVTPFAVRDMGGNISRIMIYDNNYPNQERYIEVNRTANTWRYTTAADPTQPSSDYEGDATTLSIYLRSLARRLLPQQCAFCPAPVTARGDATVRHEIHTYGNQVALLITNDAGQRLGKVAASGVVTAYNEISGTDTLEVTTNYSDTQSPVYIVPAAPPYTVTLDGSQITQAITTEVSVFGPGMFFAIEDIGLDPGQRDDIMITSIAASQLHSMSYRTTSNESPRLVMSGDFAGADYEIGAKLESDASGQNMLMALDLAAGKVALKAQSAQTETIAIDIERYNTSAQASFVYTNFQLPALAMAYLDFGTWTTNTQQLTVTIDLNSDGSIDTTLSLTGQ